MGQLRAGRSLAIENWTAKYDLKKRHTLHEKESKSFVKSSRFAGVNEASAASRVGVRRRDPEPSGGICCCRAGLRAGVRRAPRAEWESAEPALSLPKGEIPSEAEGSVVVEAFSRIEALVKVRALAPHRVLRHSTISYLLVASLFVASAVFAGWMPFK